MNKPPFYNKVYSMYGSPMGRRSSTSLFGRVCLRRVPFFDGCYDPGGAYWGAPANLWCAWDGDGNVVYLRASNRADAKRQLCEEFDELKFYR